VERTIWGIEELFESVASVFARCGRGCTLRYHGPDYNLGCIPKTFGFAPAGAFPSTLRHCLMSFPTEATKVLQRIG
jgi:hypothetical protein